MKTSNVKEYNEWLVKTLSEKPELIWNKEWRMNHLYWIINKDKEKAIFKMNKAQRHFAVNFLFIEKPFLRHVILKSRQLGFTTFIQLWMLDETIFNKNREAIGIAHLQKEAIEIFDRKVDFPLKNLCPQVKDAFFKIGRNSARKVQFNFHGEDGDTDGDNSQSSISVSTSGRSGTFHYVHISEYAPMCVSFPKRAEEVKLGTFPAVPVDGYIFIESTAETMADDFYHMFNQEWHKKDEIDADDTQYRFMPHFYNWTWDEEQINKIAKVIKTEDMELCAEINWGLYQKENELSDLEMTFLYRKWLEFGKDVRKLNQQFPTNPEEAFLASGQTYFPVRRVAEHKRNSVKGERFDILNGQLFANHIGDFEVFKKPEKGIRYILSGDTAEGLAHGDNQVMAVINCATEEIDALFVSSMSADEYPETAVSIAKMYNNALIGIESNMEGRWINATIVGNGYMNVYYRESVDDITKSMTKHYGWITSGGKNGTRGFSLMSLKAIILRTNSPIKFPMALLEEMDSFVTNTKGKPEALSGKHDDIIMCCAIGYAILFQQGKQDVTVKENEEGSLYKTIWGESDIVVFNN